MTNVLNRFVLAKKYMEIKWNYFAKNLLIQKTIFRKLSYNSKPSVELKIFISQFYHEMTRVMKRLLEPKNKQKLS